MTEQKFHVPDISQPLLEDKSWHIDPVWYRFMERIEELLAAVAAVSSGGSIIVGDGPPSAGAGVEGDVYIDTVGFVLYAPKLSGGWPPGISLSPPTPPGGSDGQIQYNNGDAFGGFDASGDATIDTATGAVDVASIGGVAPGPFYAGTDAADLTNPFNVVSFGVGAPGGVPNDGDLYFDTTLAVYVGYVGNGGAWNQF